ncbi:MAG: zinc dependent phospholipase C family protein [Flavisolibacter sp.]
MPLVFLKRSLLKTLVLSVSLLVFHPSETKAYSVLAHEALIDAVWDHYFVPALKHRYPSINDSMIKAAHAYAYGGAVASDMGYYPFGSKLFTNLVHYVRSGDYVTALIDEARTPDEYAFALGSLCHYFADVYGHGLGVNLAVPVAYPKDESKYGNKVTYEDDEISHKRIEFAFDVTETAKGNFASSSYHDFIGFKVADSVMDRAFYKTYHLHLTDVFGNFSRAVNTFRWTVKNFFPLLTKAAWSSKRAAIQKKDSTMTAKKFRYKMNRANYNKEYGKERDKPKAGAFLMGALIKILPKIGPLAPLKFKPPSPEVEKLYIRSFDSVQLHYSNALQALATRMPFFADKNLDTGADTHPGEYWLADQTYTDLVLKLAGTKEHWQNTALKQNINHFFSNGVALEKDDAEKRNEVKSALDSLKN